MTDMKCYPAAASTFFFMLFAASLTLLQNVPHGQAWVLAESFAL
jgi:hypothetical protein